MGVLSNKKVLFIFGTRPEAIKLAPLIYKFINSRAPIQPVVAVTAQHREMLDQVLGIFNIKPDFDLNLMSANQNLFELTGRIISKIGAVIQDIKPDLVFVQGDTTSTFVGALAAFYAKVPIAHIEAGLRTGNKYSPFPEEINRTLTTKLADIHFAPTIQARDNLIKALVNETSIHVVGNTVIDALLDVIQKQSSEKNQTTWKDYFAAKYHIIFTDSVKNILITGHRRESFGEGFNNICKAISILSQRSPDVNFIYPVHLNPNVQEPVFRLLGDLNNVFLIEPLDYEPFVFLLNSSYLILTDSGGIQEEAPALGKPVLVMRQNTERNEGIEAKTARLVGTDPKKIIETVEELLNNTEEYRKMALANNPYGDGTSSKKIFSIVKNLLIE